MEGVHYDKSTIASPVTNEKRTRIRMVLSIIDGWAGNIFDTKVSLLQGEFEEDTEHIYMELPGGFEKFFRPQVIL